MMTEQELQAIQKMVDIAVNALEDVKAKDIIVLDTSEKPSLFSRMIIASGDSTRQVKALANNVDLKQAAVSVNKALYQANILGANLVPEFNASLGANANRNLDTRQNSHSYSSQCTP